MPGFNYGGGVGDGTSWSSERGSEPAPGGGSTGNSGNHSGTGGSSGSGSSSAGNWAQSGPLNSALINAAIREALLNGLPRNSIASTQTPAYVSMRAAFDALPVDKQAGAREQITRAWQRAHDEMPDRVTREHDTAERTISVTSSNSAKVTMAQAVTQVSTDLQNAQQVNQANNARHQAEAAAANAAAEIQRQNAISAARIAGATQSVSQATAALDQTTRDAGAASSAASGARAVAQQKRQAATSANTEAIQAEQAYTALLAKITGKSPAGTSYSVKNGTFGYNKTITRDTANHTLTYTVWNSTGITVAQRDAAQTDAINKRNYAANLAAEAGAAEQASAGADIAARDAETRRLAAVAALDAARNEAARVAAAEQARKEAEAAEQKRRADAANKAAEEARQAAEQASKQRARQAAADKLLSADIQSVRGVPVSAPMESVPVAWAVAARGGVTLGTDVSGGVWARVTAALAELRGIATASLAGPVAVTIAALLWPEKAGAGSDVVPGRDVSGLIPGDVLSLPDGTSLAQAADSGTGVAMQVYGRLFVRDNGVLETQLVRSPVAGNVPVVRAVLDKETGYWGYTLPAMPGVPAQTILVSPADAPGVNGPLGLSGPVPLPEEIVHTGGQNVVPQGITTTTLPVEEEDTYGFILIFPAESGLKPLYVMYRSPRNMSGTVEGNGKQVGSNWLGDASVGYGAPIPSQIADKLRGREFGSFDAFRKAFWKATSDTSELNSQFKKQNRTNIKNGLSPFVPESERVGGRQRFELHHVKPISKGGAVYDVDSIRVTTPKRHIEIHKGDK